MLAASAAALGTPSEDKLLARIAAIVNRAKAGVVTTYIETDKASGETTLCRLYLSGTQMRLDSIREYDPDKPLRDPQVGLQIVTSDAVTRDGVVRLPGTFKDADAVFQAMLADPSPVSRTTLTKGTLGFSNALKLYGFTGKEWFTEQIARSDKVVATGDTSLKWHVAGKVSLEAVVSDDGKRFTKVTHEPLPGQPSGFVRAVVGPDPASPRQAGDYMATAEYRGAEPMSATFHIQSEKFGPIDPKVFHFTESEGSLLRKGGDVSIKRDGELSKGDGGSQKTPPPSGQVAVTGVVGLVLLVAGSAAVWLRRR